MPHTRTRDLVAEKGTLFWLCKKPELLPKFLDWGLTADCFSHASLQAFLLNLIKCQGRGVVGSRGIASQLQHHDGLEPKDLAKLQGWILNPPEPEIDPEQAVRTLTSLSRFNKAKSIAYDFFDNVKPISIDQNLPGLIDYFLNIGSQATQSDATPLGILESGQIYDDYVSTGYKALDELLKPAGYEQGGLARGQLVTLALPSGHGKSTFACNLAVNLARQGVGTVFFSMEMGRKRILTWMMSALALIYPSQVWKEQVGYDAQNKRDALKILNDNVRIYDGRHTISQMMTKIRAHQQEMGEKVFLAIVDRFSMITQGSKYDRRGDWKKADDTADALLGLAQDTETCVFCLNQMATQAIELWGSRMTLPSQHLLRGGQGVYNASDVVLAGGRHPGSEDGILTLEKQFCTVIYAKKVRDKGSDLGKVELRFVPAYKRLEEMT